MNEKKFRNIYYYKNYYLNFFKTLDYEVKQKFNWTLKLISQVDRVPTKYYKHIEDSTGLFEIRVEFGSNIYRVFSFFNKGQLVILINGFQKRVKELRKKRLKRQKN